MTEYRGHSPAEYKRLSAESDRLYREWWKCRDKTEAKRLKADYLAAVRAASAVAPEVDEVWRMEHGKK
jgi:hypothetical protein